MKRTSRKYYVNWPIHYGTLVAGILTVIEIIWAALSPHFGRPSFWPAAIAVLLIYLPFIPLGIKHTGNVRLHKNNLEYRRRWFSKYRLTVPYEDVSLLICFSKPDDGFPDSIGSDIYFFYKKKPLFKARLNYLMIKNVLQRVGDVEVYFDEDSFNLKRYEKLLQDHFTEKQKRKLTKLRKK